MVQGSEAERSHILMWAFKRQAVESRVQKSENKGRRNVKDYDSELPHSFLCSSVIFQIHGKQTGSETVKGTSFFTKLEEACKLDPVHQI